MAETAVQALPANTWSFTPSSDNHAYLLTRLFSAAFFHPSYGYKDPNGYNPNMNGFNGHQLMLYCNCQKMKTQPTTQTSENVAGIHNINDIITAIDKLVAVTAYVLRYIHNNHKQQPLFIGPLTAIELNTARKYWISSSQSSSYSTELVYLLKKQHPCLSLIRQLHLYLDGDNLIRCSGRIHDVPLDQLTRFPYLLPHKHPLTNMII